MSFSSTSWFSMGRMLGNLWRKETNVNNSDCDDSTSISDFLNTDNSTVISDDTNCGLVDDSDQDVDEDDFTNDEIYETDNEEWHDRELTPTKYREERRNTPVRLVNFANEAIFETPSFASLASSVAVDEQPALTQAAVMLGSTPVIWQPQVTVYQVCTPIVQPQVMNVTNNFTGSSATTCDITFTTPIVCDSPSLAYNSTTSSSSVTDSDGDVQGYNTQENNWQCYPPITSSLPPPLPAPDWPGAPQSHVKLSDIKKRLAPEVRKVWGSVHQLANSPAAGRLKSKWKKFKKSSLPAGTTPIHWGLQGQSGFEDLRRYIKQGGDFCKELATILQERSEAESQYSKTLAKLSSKLVKATKEGTATVNSAWHRIAVEMDVQADIHRHFASALTEEVVKPLKQLLESQHRIRKSVETAVDKSGKNLAEWRATESKAKKNSFTCARENEKLREPNNENRNSRLSASSLHIHKQGTDKETKLESKRRKAEECVKKADVEYYTVCLRAERSRLEWESAIVRGSHCFQVLEEERLRGLKDLATSYVQSHNSIGPKFIQMSSRIAEPLGNCDIDKDLEIVSSLRTATEPSQEQMLPDFYPEHTALAMNRDRRKQALINLLQLIRADLERERRGKIGVENLARALKQTPTFASEDSQQNVHDKLHHMRSMLTYLEAARYKVQGALAELEGGQAVSHPLAGHIHVTRDRQGYQQSVLKVPPWVHNETLDLSSEYSEWVDRGTADGTSVQPDSDFDEFSSQGSEKDYETSVIKVPEASPQRCKALYNYTANLYDELTLNPGDIINIHDKQPDGWWLGELNGVVGIFPATYVEEIK